MTKIKLPSPAKKAPVPFGKPPYEDLKGMGDDNFAMMERKLMSGETPGAVARWIQEDLGLLLNKKRTTLEVQIRRYNAKELRKKAISKIALLHGKKSTQFIMERLNALAEMEEAYVKQKDRLERILSREKELPNGILLKDASAEMRLLKDMLVDLGRLQLEVGVLTKLPAPGSRTNLNPDGTPKEFAWDEEQEEMFRYLSEVVHEDA